MPEPDFRGGAVQNNLSGWKPYKGPLSLVRPIWRNIFQHTLSHYPWTREYLEVDWIFEAFVDALGVAAALELLTELQTQLEKGGAMTGRLGFAEALASVHRRPGRYLLLPLTLKGAIHRFEDWESWSTPTPPLRARLEILEELSRLYRLDKLPEIARFTLFRNTYFKDAEPRLLDIFDRLLVRMFRHPHRRATQMVELSDLQAALTDPDDRAAFNRLAFPHRLRSRQHRGQDRRGPASAVRSSCSRRSRTSTATRTASANRPGRPRSGSSTASSSRRGSPSRSTRPISILSLVTMPSRSSAVRSTVTSTRTPSFSTASS